MLSAERGWTRMAIALQVAQRPIATTLLILLASNAVLLVFGIWWAAPALQLLSLFSSTALVTAYALFVCKFNQIFTTILLLVPASCGLIGVRAYRCLRSCNDIAFPVPPESRCSGCPDVNAGDFQFDPELPWYLFFVAHWFWLFVIVVNFIPEGICWLNMVVGASALLASLLYWVCTSLFSSFLSSTLGFFSGTATSSYNMLPREDIDASSRPPLFLESTTTAVRGSARLPRTNRPRAPIRHSSARDVGSAASAPVCAAPHTALDRHHHFPSPLPPSDAATGAATGAAVDIAVDWVA